MAALIRRLVPSSSAGRCQTLPSYCRPSLPSSIANFYSSPFTLKIDASEFPEHIKGLYEGEQPFPLNPKDPNEVDKTFAYVFSSGGLSNFAKFMNRKMGELGWVNEANIAYFKMMDTQKLPEAVIPTATIWVYGEAELGKDAFEAYQRMKLHNKKPNIVTFYLLIPPLCACNMFDAIQVVLMDMVKAGYTPSPKMLKEISESYAKEKKLDKFYFMLKELKATGFDSDSVTAEVWPVDGHEEKEELKKDQDELTSGT